jgi:preprotein translocase subunit SecA
MPLDRDQTVYRAPFAVLKNVKLWRGLKTQRYWRMTTQVLELSDRLSSQSDQELRELGQSYYQQVVSEQRPDALLAPVFALVREVATRVLGERHYPVQVLGGIALHHGHVIEMATGEGKTLVATMPAALNGMTDRGVHVVTVNDYLAQRDAEWMGKIYQFLGLSVGVVTHNSSPEQRLQAYRCAVTYVTNKELGFDFLRDELQAKVNSWFSFGKRLEQLRYQRIQRVDFHYALVDEADSILIDEARTPLIISSAPPVDPEVAEEFQLADEAARQLAEDVDYTYDRKERRVEWLKAGEQAVTRLLGGRRNKSGHRTDWHENTMRALKALLLFHRDVDYVIDRDEVLIVDEFTGRKMPGRQWEEGLHQAVAAKEGLPIKGQTDVHARTTYQILFNRYEKLSGMTGTVMTDSGELAQVYNLPTLRIPTNKPCIRKHYRDKVFASEEAKWNAVVARIRQMIERDRPVLVGTRSIDKSELLSRKLKEAGIEHVVLNALHEAEEAKIVAQAGKARRVTVATNMAGRGTDIKLDATVAAAGGLHVLGTERHESRRVDNQLRGRAARQGDPGSAEFFVSVEDPLLKRYHPRRSARLAQRFASQTVPIAGTGIARFFRRVQRTIERQHRKMRYQLIKYDRDRVRYNRDIGTE